MRPTTPILVLALALVAGAAPSTAHAMKPAETDSAATANLESLVRAERAFSALSVAEGMKQAFLTYLAEDGVVFAPGPVNGRRQWQGRPSPKSTLIWEPEYAEVAAAGDLGVSLGPWELRPPEGRDAPVVYGHFISVWARADDDPWRVAVDLGISHPKPERGVGEVKFEPGPLHVLTKEEAKRFGFGAGGVVMGQHLGMGIAVGDFVAPRGREDQSIAHETHRMMSAERTYVFDARRVGGEEALRDIAVADVQVFRDNMQPAHGLVEGAVLIGAGPHRVEFLPSGNGVSRSRDMGYSYGLARHWRPRASKPDTSSYLHVWRREPGGDWKLVVDVESPFPKR